MNPRRKAISSKILPRQNELIRPAVANIDQALVVFAITKPNPHFNLLDRFLVMMESKEIPVVLCFNKEDIATDPQIKRTGRNLRNMWLSNGIRKCKKKNGELKKYVNC